MVAGSGDRAPAVSRLGEKRNDSVKFKDSVFPFFLSCFQVAKIINQLDGDGNLPLGLALAEKQTAIANVLCEHKADVNAKDQAGWSLLQRAIQRGN